MAKPSIKTGVANQYAAPNERIYELTSGRRNGPGALVSVRELDDGKVLVEIYRRDAGVTVRVADPEDVDYRNTRGEA